MKKSIFDSDPLARRARRSAREILLAIILTLAAVAAVVAAIRGMEPETAAIVDPGAKSHSKAN